MNISLREREENVDPSQNSFYLDGRVFMLIVFDPLHNLLNHLPLVIGFVTFVPGNNDAINIPVPKSLQSYTDKTVGKVYILLDQRKYTFYFWSLPNCPPKRLQSIPLLKYMEVPDSIFFAILFWWVKNGIYDVTYFIKYCDAFICILLIMNVIKDIFLWFYFFFCALYFLFLVWLITTLFIKKINISI